MSNQYSVILRATNDKQQKFDLELVNTPEFLLDISAIEAGNIGKAFGISSQQFTLPGNQTNNQFFNNLFDLGSTPSVGLTHTVPCQVLVNGQAVFTGKLYVNNIITDQTNNIIYNCVVVNETVDFRTRIDNRALIDLDWSAYNHTYTWTNISSSWNDQLLSGSVFYPLVHYGKDPNNTKSAQVEFGGNPGQIDNSTTPLLVTNFKPAIRAKAVLDTVFNTVGYRYTSSFFNSEYFKSVYLLATNNEFAGANINNLVSQSAYVYKNGNQDILPSGTPTTVQYNAKVYDNGNAFNTGTFAYTAAFTGKYTINVSVPFEIRNYTGASAGRVVTIDVFQNGTSPLNAFSTNLYQKPNGTIGFAPFTATLTAGDTITVVITYDSSAGERFRVLTGTNTWLKVQGPQNVIGATVNMGLQLPSDLKITDFIQGLINKYNLVMEPVSGAKNLLRIEPFNDWVDLGIIRDWTDKVDRDTKWEIRHPLGDQPKRLKFTDKLDEDVINKYQNTTFKNIYGEYNYASDSDLTTGTKTIETVFGATPVKPIPGSFHTVLPFLYKQDQNKYGQPFKFTPRLLHKQALATISADEARGFSGSIRGYYYMNDGTTTFPLNYYRTLGGLTDSPAVYGTTFDIHYDNTDFYPYQQSYNNGRTNNDAYTAYWSFYINELYDVDTRLVTMNIVLNPSEIQNIQLNDKIFVDGHYYRINKIQGANLIDQQSTKVELLKTLPRRLYFPRRRIYTTPEIFVDVVQGNLLDNGSTSYTYYDSGEPVDDAYVLAQASARDNNIAFSSSVVWDQTKPIIYNPNVIVLGATDYDETSNNVLSVGNNGTIPQQTQDVALLMPTTPLASYKSGSTYTGELVVQNSQQVTGSIDITGQYLINGVPISGSGGGTTNTGSLLVTASYAYPNLTFTKGDGSTFDILLPSGSYTPPPATTYITASGGIETTSGSFKIHTFTGSANFIVTQTGSGALNNIDYLIVAGGGGGGNYVGGGGGAGGAIYNTGSSGLTATTYTLTVGTGGPSETDGNDSVFFGQTAIKGGRGARGGCEVGSSAGAGGCGGGGGAGTYTGGAAGTTGQGFAGGSAMGCSSPYSSGGGGGTAVTGSNGSGAGSGNGGNGIYINISGTPTYYGGGGGGCSLTNQGTGGQGGGGTGTKYNGDGSVNTAGTAGTANTGGGGGGGETASGTRVGYAGGSGIIIIKYQYQP